MSSRHRNFRRRTDDDEGGDDDNGNADKPPSSRPTSTTKPPKKPQNQAPKKLLSFADDEDNDSPITRPSSSSKSSKSRFPKPSSSSSSSHKLTAVKDRVTPSSSVSSSLPSNVQPQAGTYTKEALLELQKNTRTLASSRPPPSTAKPTSSSFEPVVVLKGLVKPESDSIGGTIAKLGDQEEEETENNKRADLFRRDKDDAATRLASIGLGKGGSNSRDSIPDQATIDAIRAKRERLRQSQAAAPDYIALDGGSNHGEAEGLSDEEPEFQGRIALFGDKLDTGKKGVFEDVVDGRAIDVGFRKDGEVDADDEDEEDKIWEEEQFRKGLGKRMDDGSSRVGSSAVPVVQSVPQQNYMYPPAATSSYSSVPSVPAGPSIGGAVGAFSGLDVMSISQQADIAKKALHDNLKRLKESHGRTIASLTRTDENLSASLLNVTALEQSLSAAGEKFIFMQKIRDFVSVICDFLQHKAPFIEELEELMQKLHEKRAAAILERRAADQDDEMIEIEAAINAATMVLSKGGGNTALVEASTTAAQAASAAMREKNLPEKLDEFGRDENLKKRIDMARREEARRRRKAQSDSKRISSMENDSSYQQIEGESSTDESDSESTAYQSNRDLLLQTAEQIFSDAAEEYSQLSVVKERFERWKKDYLSSYNDAYVSLNVAAIFSPYVRLELLKWDPLHEDADFDNMKWHTLLYNYGIEDEGKINPDDADADLIPQLVEKIAIPILHHEIAYCWDIASTRETKNAVSATNLVFSYVPTSSRVIGELVTVLRNRLTEAVANLMVPTWSTLVMKAVPNASRIAAYRFGMSVRLMRNICLWNNILAMAVLEKLALDDLLIRKVLPHLRSIQSNIHDAITRTERTIAALYGVWAGPSVTGERSPKLQPLVDYLLILGKTLEKKHVSGVSETETTRLARRLKKMLVELNEYDQARAISRTFNLKEAL